MMETLEIHSKSFLIKWINVPDGDTLSWQGTPQKKSISFGLFRRPPSVQIPETNSNISSNRITESNNNITTGRRPSLRRLSSSGPHVPLKQQLQKSGLQPLLWRERCPANEPFTGTHTATNSTGSMFAFVFDNTFSKTFAKTVLFTYQITTGAPHSLSSVDLSAKSYNVQRSQSKKGTNPPRETIPNRYLTGILLKKRRKKLQGFARRYFVLDLETGLLTYYLNSRSSVLRGSMPLGVAAVSARKDSREFFIDSGSEVWSLRAQNQEQWQIWKEAFEKSRVWSRTHGENPSEIAKEDLGVDVYLLSSIEGIYHRLMDTQNYTKQILSEELDQNNHHRHHHHHHHHHDDDHNSIRSIGELSSKSSILSLHHNKPDIIKEVETLDTRIDDIAKDLGDLLLGYRDKGLAGNKSTSNNFVGESNKVNNKQSPVVQQRPRTRASPSLSPRTSCGSATEYFDAKEGPESEPGVVMLPDKEEPSSSSSGESEENDDNLVVVEDDSGAEESDSENDESDQKTVEDNLDLEMPLTTSDAVRPPKYTQRSESQRRDLYPLGEIAHVKRRTNVPKSVVDAPSLYSFLRRNVGKDLSTVAMPVSANEPIDVLQKYSEDLEYSSLLDEATKLSESPGLCILYIATFAITSLSNMRSKVRCTRKPFNPLLGETFELVREDRGFRLLAEKVSHRPNIFAIHAESHGWSYSQSPKPDQKFWGKSAELVTTGKIYIKLFPDQQEQSDDLARTLSHTKSGRSLYGYYWHPPNCFLRNVLAGEKYIEPSGSCTIHGPHGVKAVIHFKSGGLFSGRSESLHAEAFDESGKSFGYRLEGTWTESLTVTMPSGEKKEIWKASPLPPDSDAHFGFTVFASQLNEITPIEKGNAAPTDSRFRPDQRMFEQGDIDDAEEKKLELEEKQRQRRRKMEENGNVWKPHWFQREADCEAPNGEATQEDDCPKDSDRYVFIDGDDGYWNRRRNGKWNDCIKLW